MKNLFLFVSVLSLNVLGHAQQEFKDLIVTYSNDSIQCKITLQNENNFFYDHKTRKGIVNDMLAVNEVKHYSYAGKQLISTKNLEKDTAHSLSYNGTKYIYCEIVGTQKILSSQVVVSVDYGQERSFLGGISAIKEDNGKMKSFNSMIDALNYMGREGWEFVQAFTVTSTNQNVYHYLLKRSQ